MLTSVSSHVESSVDSALSTAGGIFSGMKSLVTSASTQDLAVAATKTALSSVSTSAALKLGAKFIGGPASAAAITLVSSLYTIYSMDDLLKETALLQTLEPKILHLDQYLGRVEEHIAEKSLHLRVSLERSNGILAQCRELEAKMRLVDVKFGVSVDEQAWWQREERVLEDKIDRFREQVVELK
eukprot:GILI01018542.1.p1 GENE.GILI01018542.1~~GILI01018542.1.p1  ORF type:complete len:195 (-),score=33.54 GILI01018542.1:221-772(-)